MASADSVAEAQQKAVDQIRDVIKRRGTPEMVERVEALEAYPVPGSRWSVRADTVTGADLFLQTLAEDVADLAAIIDRLAERRGRKPNIMRDAHD